MLLGCLVAQAAGLVREESLGIFGGRRVAVAPPPGFVVKAVQDQAGQAGITVSEASGRYSLEIAFLPDGDGRHASTRSRRELMHELFNEYVGSSKEKGMQFEELQPRSGAGTYCVFTDANLEGRKDLPPGEYLHLTAGLKAWPGVIAVFRFFSDETESAQYRAIIKMLRESLVEKPVPLR
jgi:hypothetical protein